MRGRVMICAAVAALGAVACTPDPGAGAGPPEPALACYDSGMPGQVDFDYNGPLNQVGNSDLYSSTDGSCTGSLIAAGTMVYAADLAGANSLCAVLVPGSSAFALASGGYPLAPEYHGCIIGL